MPECSGKECTYGTTYKISCHKNGINTVGCFRVEGENRSLITQLDTLHTYIYNKNSGDDEGGNLAASKIRNLECPNYEICLIDYGCGKFNRKIHIMEQYP